MSSPSCVQPAIPVQLRITFQAEDEALDLFAADLVSALNMALLDHNSLNVQVVGTGWTAVRVTEENNTVHILTSALVFATWEQRIANTDGNFWIPDEATVIVTSALDIVKELWPLLPHGGTA